VYVSKIDACTQSVDLVKQIIEFLANSIEFSPRQKSPIPKGKGLLYLLKLAIKLIYLHKPSILISGCLLYFCE